MIFGIGTITHEPFLHGLTHRGNFLKDNVKQFLGAKDHSDPLFSDSYFSKVGLSVMQQGLEKINTISYRAVELQVSKGRMEAMIHMGRGLPGWNKLSGVDHKGETYEDQKAAYNDALKVVDQVK